MEKKTTGSFLNTLRKAKGMTQKELAELLNVSDKAVSRWERDESMPDILLLPVLADIFEVSCDELLQGEKISKDNYEESPEKKMNRMKALVKKSKSRFQAFSMISIGVPLLGFLFAIILNFSFHKATLGFFLVLIGIIAGGMTQAALYFYFKGDVDTDELENSEFTAFKKYIRDHTLHISYLLGIVLCICLPLLFMGQVNYADYIASISETMSPLGYDFDMSSATSELFATGTIAVGLQPKTWLIYGGIGGIVSAMICIIVNHVIKMLDVKHGRFNISTEDLKNDRKKFLYLMKYLLVLTILLGSTYAGSRVFKERMPDYFKEGTQFDNFDDFKEHMETIPRDMYKGVVELRQKLDKYKGTIYGDDGELLCEYRIYNDSVINIEYGDNNKLPITTYTEEDYALANQRTEALMWIWSVVMAAECFAVLTFLVINLTKKRG